MENVDDEPRKEPNELGAIRHEIDRIDAQLLDLIAARRGLAVATLGPKRRSGLLATDFGREAEVVRRSAMLARERGLDPEAVRDIFWRLIDLSRAAFEVEPGKPRS